MPTIPYQWQLISMSMMSKDASLSAFVLCESTQDSTIQNSKAGQSTVLCIVLLAVSACDGNLSRWP